MYYLFISVTTWLVDFIFKSIRNISILYKEIKNPEYILYTNDLSLLTQGINTKMTYVYHPHFGNLQVSSDYSTTIQCLSKVPIIKLTIKMAIIYPHQIDVLEKFKSVNHNLHINEVLVSDIITLQDDETVEILMSNGSYGDFNSNERIPF